jgi:hypothetical protein
MNGSTNKAATAANEIPIASATLHITMSHFKNSQKKYMAQFGEIKMRVAYATT